jgi:hypothetical protein
MVRAREDFATFVRARWTELTDELVDDELTRAQAQQAVVRGLADCQAGWRRVLAEDNPEVVVREAIASHRTTALPDEPVTEPLAAIAGVRSERRRRVWRLTVVSGLAAAVTAALVMFWPHPEVDPQPARRAEANLLPIAWWYGGELHLGKVVVEIPRVTELHRSDGSLLVVSQSKGVLMVGESGRVSDYHGSGPALGEKDRLPHPELIPDTQVARSWTTTPAGNFVYAVQHRANEHAADESIRLSTSGPWLILQCSLQAHPGFAPCETITQLPADSAQPPVFERP